MSDTTSEPSITTWEDAQKVLKSTSSTWQSVHELLFVQGILGVIPFTWIWACWIDLVNIILIEEVKLNFKHLAAFFNDANNYADPALFEETQKKRKEVYATFD